MNRSLWCALLVAGTCAGLYANEPANKGMTLSREKLEIIEQNLVIGLQSNNPGLQASTALVLDQLKALKPDYSFDLTLVPLMRLVRERAYDETARIAAGLALHDLHSSMGDYLIARGAREETDARVKRVFAGMSCERGLQDALN